MQKHLSCARLVVDSTQTTSDAIGHHIMTDAQRIIDTTNGRHLSNCRICDTDEDKGEGTDTQLADNLN